MDEKTRTALELRAFFVDMACSYYGYNEADGSFRSIIDIYNSQKVLPRGYKVKYTDEWCATYVSAMAILCGLTEILPTECGCEKMINAHKLLGTWVENDDFVPQAGDLIFYDWGDSGKGDNVGYADHVGIVTRVADGWIGVVEGNLSNKVNYRSIPVNAQYIRGFAVPAYERLAKEEKEPELGDVSSWAKESCRKAVKSGLITGYGDGNYGWKDAITREQMCVVLDRMRLLG